MHHEGATARIARALKQAFPAAEAVHANRGDIEVCVNDELFAATAPREYEQYVYDCLKCDIVVVADKNGAAAARTALGLEKSASAHRKENVMDKLNIVRGTLGELAASELFTHEMLSKRALSQEELDELGDKKLVDGIVGRGSYFDSNGYPSVDDDIDLMLLQDTVFDSKEDFYGADNQVRSIIISSEADFSAKWAEGKEHGIKTGSAGSPAFSFNLVSKGRVLHPVGGPVYLRHVLETGTGIDAGRLTAQASERLSHRFADEMGENSTLGLIKEGKIDRFPAWHSGAQAGGKQKSKSA